MEKTKPIRRVVTGHDRQGRSCVRWDGPATNVHEASSGPGRSHPAIWARPYLQRTSTVDFAIVPREVGAR
jgi:hypothetical protein